MLPLYKGYMVFRHFLYRFVSNTAKNLLKFYQGHFHMPLAIYLIHLCLDRQVEQTTNIALSKIGCFFINTSFFDEVDEILHREALLFRSKCVINLLDCMTVLDQNEFNFMRPILLQPPAMTVKTSQVLFSIILEKLLYRQEIEVIIPTRGTYPPTCLLYSDSHQKFQKLTSD